MATEREKKLSILLLKERIEHITGKRVVLEENSPVIERYESRRELQETIGTSLKVKDLGIYSLKEGGYGASGIINKEKVKIKLTKEFFQRHPVSFSTKDAREEIKSLLIAEYENKKKLQETVELDTDSKTNVFVPEKGLSDENESRPSRMKKPEEVKNGWKLFSYSKKGQSGGLYIQDDMRNILIDKYGKERGERNFNGILNAPSHGAFYQYGTQIAAEKAGLLRDLKIDYDSSDYFQYSYYSLWKEWMRKIGKPVNIKQQNLLKLLKHL